VRQANAALAELVVLAATGTFAVAGAVAGGVARTSCAAATNAEGTAIDPWAQDDPVAFVVVSERLGVPGLFDGDLIGV
jgi:hypothetical protein